MFAYQIRSWAVISCPYFNVYSDEKKKKICQQNINDKYDLRKLSVCLNIL